MVCLFLWYIELAESWEVVGEVSGILKIKECNVPVMAHMEMLAAFIAAALDSYHLRLGNAVKTYSQVGYP